MSHLLSEIKAAAELNERLRKERVAEGSFPHSSFQEGGQSDEARRAESERNGAPDEMVAPREERHEGGSDDALVSSDQESASESEKARLLLSKYLGVNTSDLSKQQGSPSHESGTAHSEARRSEEDPDVEGRKEESGLSERGALGAFFGHQTKAFSANEREVPRSGGDSNGLGDVGQQLDSGPLFESKGEGQAEKKADEETDDAEKLSSLLRLNDDSTAAERRTSKDVIVERRRTPNTLILDTGNPRRKFSAGNRFAGVVAMLALAVALGGGTGYGMVWLMNGFHEQSAVDTEASLKAQVRKEIQLAAEENRGGVDKHKKGSAPTVQSSGIRHHNVAETRAHGSLRKTEARNSPKPPAKAASQRSNHRKAAPAGVPSEEVRVVVKESPVKLAREMADKGKVVEAFSLLKRHLLAHPSDKVALAMAITLAERDRGEIAPTDLIEIASAALDADPYNGDAGVLLLAQLINTDPAQAASVAESHPYLLEGNPFFASLGGTAFLMTGRADKAVAILESLLSKGRFPGRADALYNLGVAYSRLGEKDKAVEAWQRAYHLARSGDEHTFDLTALHSALTGAAGRPAGLRDRMNAAIAESTRSLLDGE